MKAQIRGLVLSLIHIFLYRLTRRPSLLSGLGEAEFSGILDYANAVGSLITTKRGAIAAIPNEQEIRHCMEHTPRAGRQ